MQESVKNNKAEKIFLGVMVGFFVLAVLIPLIFLIRPAERRALQLDNQRVNMMQNLSGEIDSYYKRNGSLPEGLTFLLDETTYTDPETGDIFGYEVVSSKKYRLCTVFATDSSKQSESDEPRPVMYGSSYQTQHGKGYQCLEFEVSNTTTPPEYKY